MPDIEHGVLIREKPDVVLRALTTIDGLRGWWTQQTDGVAALGGHLSFDFDDRFHNEMVVESIAKRRRIVWRCEKGDDQWVGTKLTFDLEPHAEGTWLKFGHRGWNQSTDFMKSCDSQWETYLKSLQSLCEKGHGKPHVATIDKSF
jgi:uncharacterized protein YndB with AHSA1/START domain